MKGGSEHETNCDLSIGSPRGRHPESAGEYSTRSTTAPAASMSIFMTKSALFLTCPIHEKPNIRYLPPMPSYFRLLYFGLEISSAATSPAEKAYDVAVISAATATSALWAPRPTPKRVMDSQ